MTQELATKLKEAGFPLKQMFPNLGPEEEFKIHPPTLEELIEACGERKPTIGPWNVFEWQAYVPHETLRQIIQGIGKTPEEAVAALHIKLKECSGYIELEGKKVPCGCRGERCISKDCLCERHKTK